MTKTSRVLLKIARWTLLTAVIAAASLFMAFLSEGFALQHGFFNGTPGLIVSARTVPPSLTAGLKL
jgi:hypothetical protein